MADAGKRIGLFGGTFDPVHAGHLAIADLAAQELALDQVLFIPAADPPHKKKTGASYQHRLAMLEIALAQGADEQDRFAISLLEAELSVPSYTVDTLLELKNRFTGQFYFILGADSLLELHLWYQYHHLLQLTSFIVISRPGIPLSAMEQAITLLPGFFLPDSCGRHWFRTDGAQIILLQNKLRKDISSTLIRQQLRKEKSLACLHHAVGEYIYQYELYKE
ncbi:MAG: nicotinate (nicotinamide) nucleotide adenylyltransferase [Candidatus Electrothrix sp. AR3]|nr:nicotinate (nicotinamide) nucleotide adenylyltransferase [Candidatus Electrothrix sp. AR3]